MKIFRRSFLNYSKNYYLTNDKRLTNNKLILKKRVFDSHVTSLPSYTLNNIDKSSL